MIRLKPSIELCARKKCAKRDTDALQLTTTTDVRVHSSGRDRQHGNIHLIDVRRITQKLESVQDHLKATVRSLTQGRDRDLEIVRHAGDLKAAHSVHGKLKKQSRFAFISSVLDLQLQ